VALVEHPAERDAGGSSAGGRRTQIEGQGSIV
jgi:hypothetical protein